MPTGQHPQLISSAWRIRNLSSDIQATVTSGSSNIAGPEVAFVQDSSKNERQEYDKMAPVLNEEIVIREQDHEQTVMSSSSSSSFSRPSPSLLQPCVDRNPKDFAYSIGSTTAPVASQVVGSIPDRQRADETEAVGQRPPGGILPVATGSCGISYADGHVTGSEIRIGDEKTGYMNLRHKSRR